MITCLETRKQVNHSRTSSAPFIQPAGWRKSRVSGGTTLRATFCTRLALVEYEALSAVQLQRQVRSQNFVHKLATQEWGEPLR
jgi:hypothetical protein